MSPQAADRLPDVAFRKPTEEEADRIDRLFSGENEVASEDFRRLFACESSVITQVLNTNR